MRRLIWATAVGTVLAVGACGDASGAESPAANEQGDVVSTLPGNNNGDTYVLRRECDGTTAIYTMKDYGGYDFQIVLGDPRCAAAK